jgi:hypothetical protein
MRSECFFIFLSFKNFQFLLPAKTIPIPTISNSLNLKKYFNEVASSGQKGTIFVLVVAKS